MKNLVLEQQTCSFLSLQALVSSVLCQQTVHSDLKLHMIGQIPDGSSQL